MSNSQPVQVHRPYPMNAYERAIEMNDEERRLNLVLHIVKLDSQIERAADHSEITALKTQRRSLYVELAAMQSLRRMLPESETGIGNLARRARA